MNVREVALDAVPDWDARAVEAPGGNAYQGSAWAAYRSRWGWRARFLLFDDGFPLLSIERPWPLVGGAGAYISKGPVPSEAPARTAERLVAAARYLGANGVDVVSADPEVPANEGYEALVCAAGFRPIEEIQPSRHRMTLPLAGREERGLFRACTEGTRQGIRAAEKAGLRVVRYEGEAAPRTELDGTEPVRAPDPTQAAEVFGRLYELMEATAQRRHFSLSSRGQFVDWGVAGLAAGIVVELEIRTADDDVLGAAMFYRHGGRLTYSHSADRADVRRKYPGVSRLLLWRAIQLALAEGRDEVDFAGVDVPGMRRRPEPGDEMYGLYEFKRSFGAEFVELAGNHELRLRPRRELAGRVAARLTRSRAFRRKQ